MKRIYNFSDISSGLLRIMMIPALLLGAAAVRAGTLTHEVQIDLSEIRGTLKEYAGEEFMVFEPKTLDLTSEEGKPMLPVKYIRLAVPTYASNFRVSTQSQPFTQYTMPHRIFPAQMPILTNENKTDSFLPPDSTYYNTNSWSPVAEYKGTGYLEGEQQIVTVAVYPISYNPVSSESRIYSTVTLNLEYDIVTADDLPLKPIITNACGYASYIRNIVDNPVETDNIYLPPNTPSDPSLPFLSIKNYYIITSRNLVESFAELAAWKSQKGYNVKLIAIEDIINGPLNVGYDPNSALQDDASLLRKYLRTEYENNGIYFLFLGGDESNMPVFRVKTTKPKSPPKGFQPQLYVDNSHLAPTDLYFYDFNSVWDVNDDGEYSIDREEANTRIDYYPEIYTGRILCTEPKHVENYTKKLIKYESNPGNGDFAYLRRSYFSAYHEMNYTAKKAKGTFEAYDFFDPEESFLREDSQNHNPKGIDVIEDMKRHYGFFSWHGHGNPYIISVGSYNDYDSDGKKNSGIYYISSCDNTTSKEDREYGFTGINRIDNKDYPSIAYSIACITSPFDRYISDNKPYDNIRFCNAFTIEGDYGGPAFLGNTRFGSVSTSHYLEQSFAKFLADTYIVGVAECQSKADSPINDYAKLSHNLIGEPEFKMWSNLPQKFNDISIIFENNELFMEGNNLMKSRIGLTDFNKSYNFIAYYNELQKNNVDIQNPIISIWKNNYLPLILWSPCKQELTECKKKLTLTEAVLGLDKVDNESEFFIIGNNSDLDLNLRDKIVLNPGFRLIGNGQLKIKSGGTVKIKGSEIKDNASLMISAPSAIIDNGFEIGNGAVMQINVLN